MIDRSGAVLQVWSGLFGPLAASGRLQDDVDPEVAPWEVAHVFLAQHADLAAVHDEPIMCVRDGARERAVGRIVLEQQCVELGFDEVVDRHDLDVGGALDERLERLASDPPETVDADTRGHVASPSFLCTRLPPSRRR